MNNQRRNVLRLTSVIALMASTGLITSAQAAEWNKAAFEGKNLDDVLKAIGGAKPETSADIIMRAPDIAENGAVVPVGVETKLKATQIAILVEKNPSNLAAQFMLPEGAEAFVTTRWVDAPVISVAGECSWLLEWCARFSKRAVTFRRGLAVSVA